MKVGEKVLFIDEVMTKIWEPTSKIYKDSYQEALELSLEELYENLKNVEMPYYQHDMSKLSNLITSGCSHHIRRGNLSGCSMCNLHSEEHKVEAMMQALKEKDIKMYCKVIRDTFENSRGIVDTRSLQEFIFSHNFLNKNEIPDKALEELFGTSGVFKRRPMKYEFETSAKSVTSERLNTLEKYIGKNGIWIRIGVECSNEWIRNHWINKEITDEDIKSAIEACHKIGYKVTANMIMGIPGLTEENSLKVFKDTIKWLENLKIDMYTCSVLDRKDTTLQGYLYNKLNSNERLEHIGIIQGEHTGLPWLFTFLRGLYWGLKEIPNFKNKITLGQFQPKYITGNHTMAYNYKVSCECQKKIFDTLRTFAFDRNVKKIEGIMQWIEQDPCYEKYMKLLEKQKGAGGVAENIIAVGEEMAKILWPTEHKEKIEKLKGEISYFNNDALK